MVSYLLPHDPKVLFNLVNSATIAHLVIKLSSRLDCHEVQRDDGCLAFVDDEDNNDDDQDDYWKDDADNDKEEDDDTDHILLGLHRLHAQLRHRLLEGERLRIVIVVMVMIMMIMMIESKRL